MLTVIAICALVLALLGILTGLLALRTLGRLRRSIRVLNRATGGRGETLLETTARHIEVTENARREFAELTERLTQTMADLQTTTQSGIDTRLDVIRAGLTDEIAQLRARFEADELRLNNELAAQRAALATDNSAARDQLRNAVARAEKAIDGSLRRVALVRFDAFDDLDGRLSFCLALLDGRGDGVALTALSGRAETRMYAKPINAGKSPSELSPEEHQAVEAALSA
jgi:hypothetical protein